MSPELSRKNFARNLYTWRTKNGISQKQLSEDIGWSESHLSLVERGLRFPSWDSMVNAANVLGFDLETMMKEGEKTKEQETKEQTQ